MSDRVRLQNIEMRAVDTVVIYSSISNSAKGNSPSKVAGCGCYMNGKKRGQKRLPPFLKQVHIGISSSVICVHIVLVENTNTHDDAVFYKL